MSDLQIKPLVRPTKDIMKEPIRTFQWHEFFPHGNNNIGIVIALWAPIILVYFMDTQIWYAIFSTLIGGIYGACRRLGEIRTLGMLRSRFESLPKAFNQRLIPSDSNKRRGIRAAFSSKPTKTPEDSKEEEKIAARFAQIWNLIITSFREEDLIDNREKDLLLVPYCKDRDMDIIQWPPFLLASKIPIALDMAADSEGKDRDLKKRVKSDPYFTYAIKECYASFKNIIYTLVVGAKERDVIQKIFTVVDDHIAQDTLIKELNMSNLPTLSKKFIELLELLQKNNKEDQGQVIILFQDMLEVVTRDIMDEQLSGLLESVHGGNNRRYEGITPLDQQDQLFTKAIDFPVKESHAWTEKIKRLHLLLTVKESAMDVPTNLDARRRISFFANSLFMDMPSAPKVRHMLPFS
jgi:callose synthase